MSKRLGTRVRLKATAIITRLAVVISMAACCQPLLASVAEAMPPGRAWAPIDTLKVHGHAYVVPSRFEPIRDGRIELLGNGYYGDPGIRTTYGMVWADSVWRERWDFRVEGYRMWPTYTPPDHQMLVWKSTPDVPGNQYLRYLVTADVVGDTVSAPDTIASVSSLVLVHSATALGRRRWVAVRDESPSTRLRVFLSDSPRQWREIPTPGLTSIGGPQVIALDSVTALVVSGERLQGVQWGILRDTTFTQQSPPVYDGYISGWPAMGPRKSGGFWTAWFQHADQSDQLFARRFSDSAWMPPETLSIRFPGPYQYLLGQPEMSAEGSDIPAMAWFGYTYQGGDAAYYVFASFPTDSGFGVGERVEGSWNGINPTLVRDENEDVWLAWWREYDGIYWTHSRTTVSASAPVVGESKGRPSLTWSITGSAPGTWWAVMRGVDGAPSERVARVRATPDTVLRWTDESGPSDKRMRYAIRRECRDVRYEELSAEAEWLPRRGTLGFRLLGQNPLSESVRGELSGTAAGAFEISVFDLQGRLLTKRSFTATGSGQDAFELGLPRSLRAGVYVMRAVGADGRKSGGTKIVVLR